MRTNGNESEFSTIELTNNEFALKKFLLNFVQLNRITQPINKCFTNLTILHVILYDIDALSIKLVGNTSFAKLEILS